MTALWPAGFAPFCRPNWGPKKVFWRPPPPPLSQGLDLALVIIFLFHCVSSRGELLDQKLLTEVREISDKMREHHFSFIHSASTSVCPQLIRVYSNTGGKHQHPEWKQRWSEVNNWHIRVLLRVLWDLSSSWGFHGKRNPKRFYSCWNESSLICRALLTLGDFRNWRIICKYVFEH